MKNKEELKNLKEEVENESRKPHELTEEDLEQVTGGLAPYNLHHFAPVIHKMRDGHNWVSAPLIK